jgi:serine/threonine protein kinase
MVKLCDFGFAAETEQARKTICGTYEYMSPEMVVGEPYSQKNDVWSLGVLLYELIEGTSPFRGENREQIFASMRQGVRFSKKFTEEEISLISSILKFNPYHRPEVVQILKHVYFQGQCELANFTNLLTEPTSPNSSRQIKLL